MNMHAWRAQPLFALAAGPYAVAVFTFTLHEGAPVLKYLSASWHPT